MSTPYLSAYVNTAFVWGVFGKLEKLFSSKEIIDFFFFKEIIDYFLDRAKLHYMLSKHNANCTTCRSTFILTNKLQYNLIFLFNKF